MATLQSKLILSLVDRITAPARGIKRAVSGLQDAHKRNNAAIARSQTQMAGAVGVAYALGKAISSPVQSAMEFESSMADVKKVVDDFDTSTSNGRKLFSEFKGGLRDLSTQIPLATRELGEIAAAAGEAGFAGDDLLKITEAAAKISVAFGSTASDTGKMLASMQQSYGMSHEEAMRLADTMNHLSNNMASNAPQLMDFWTRTAADAKQGGFSQAQAVALGSAMVASGAQADTAATSFRNMVKSLTRGESATKRQVTAYDRLGLSAKDVAKGMQKDAVGTTRKVLEALGKVPDYMKKSITSDLFGDEAKALGSLITNMDNFDKAIGQLGSSEIGGSAFREFDVRAETFEAKLITFKNTFNSLSVAIGTQLLPVLTDLMNLIVPYIQAIAKAARENPRLTATVVALSAGLVALRVAAVAAQFSFLWMKGGFLSAAIVGLKGIGLAATIAGGGLKALVAVGLFPFKAIIGGAKAARLALIRFRISAMLVGVGPAILAATASGAKGFLSLLRPMALVRGALRLLKLAVIGTGIGAILVAIATAGALIYENWSGIKAMFVAFGNAFMEALGPAKPIIDPIIDGFKLLKKAWDSFAGAFTASDKSWAEFGASAGRAVGKVVKWFTELPGRIATAIGKIDLSDFISWPEPPGWWKKLFGGDEEKKPVSTPKPEAVDSSKLTNSPVIPDEAAAQKAKANIDNMVGAVKQGADAATAEARIAGAHIQEGLGVTATPKVDTTEIERALSLTNQLKSSIRSVGSTTANSGIAGARAAGGNVAGGKTYLVGERGPELVTPTRSGYVHSAGDTADLMSQGGGSSPQSPNARVGAAVQAQSGGLRDVHVHINSVSDRDDLYNYVKTQLAQDVQGELSGAQGDTDWSVG